MSVGVGLSVGGGGIIDDVQGKESAAGAGVVRRVPFGLPGETTAESREPQEEIDLRDLLEQEDYVDEVKTSSKKRKRTKLLYAIHLLL